jgi:C-terminal processing protease CtpA/Prc
LCTGPGDKGWVVKTTVKDSPAAKSGEITEGDVLVEVDGKPVDEVLGGGGGGEGVTGERAIDAKVLRGVVLCSLPSPPSPLLEH